MPIKDKDKNREYQRKWAAKKARNQALVIKEAKFTYEQVLELKETQKIAQYKTCVTQAKAIVTNDKCSRVKIALLCIRACDIQHGGDQRHPIENSVKNFAKSIGLHHKTLHDWVVVVKRVWLKLSTEEQRNFKMITAQNAISHGAKIRSKTDDELVDVYRDISTDRAKEMAIKFKSYLSSAEQALTRYNVVAKLSKEERAASLKRAERIVEILS